MSTPAWVGEFVSERNEALGSLDQQKIEAYARKWGAALPLDGSLVFWAAVHKARLSINAFSDEEQEVSRRWLLEHGFTPEGL